MSAGLGHPCHDLLALTAPVRRFHGDGLLTGRLYAPSALTNSLMEAQTAAAAGRPRATRLR